MTRTEFIQFAENLAAYYGRKFDPQRAVVVYPKVEHVPSEAVGWILDHLTDTNDNMPSNIGKAVLSGWYGWQKANPNRMVSDEKQDCPHCRLGYVFVQSDTGTAVSGCPICRQAPAGYPLASRAELIGQGWSMQETEVAATTRTRHDYAPIPPAYQDDERETERRTRHIPEAEQVHDDCPF